MASVPLHIANLLDKMTSLDKDFRFMATNDLMAELQKDSIKLDDDSEKKVVKMLLKLLADKNGEVQNLAVKCLGPLVNKVKDTQVETIVDTLCSNMLAEKEQLRDISSIGLKTVINELGRPSGPLAANVCRKITSQLTSSMAKQEDVSIQLEILDILSDLLNRFGFLLVSFHPSILQNLLPQLASPRLAVRKRTIVAVSYLANSCNNALFAELMNFLIAQLEKNASLSTTRTYIQCLGAITRQAGHRVGEHLDRALPLVTHYCNIGRANQPSSNEGEDDDELRECCIQSLESFARRCPKDVGPHLEKVISICLAFLVYDPNYSYGDDGDPMDVQSGDDRFGDEDDDDDDGERDDSDYSDDDDVSWKVRRASAKCLAAIFSIRHDMLCEFYEIVSPALVSRFKEREENVKSDIFAAYVALLRQTRSTTSVTNDDDMDVSEGPLSLLAAQVPSIIGSVSKLLKEKSIKTRQGCFSLLSELVQTLPGALRDHIHLVTPGLQTSLVDKNSTATMKIEALTFLNLLLTSHPCHVFRPHLRHLVPPVIQCMGDSFYKVASEALLVAQHLVKVIRPLDVDPPVQLGESEMSYLNNIFAASVARLTATDVDQEVKERAIACSAQLICQSVDLLGHDKVSECLPVIIVDRLRNETTRLAAARAFVAVASSFLRVDLSPELLADCVPLLGSFLRKNQRGLKLCSLQCLEALVRNGYATSTNALAFDATTGDAATLVSDADLHVAQMALQFLAALCRARRARAVTEESLVLVQVIEFVKSPLLQGSALQAVIEFLVALLCAHEDDPSPSGGGASIDVLFKSLTQPVYDVVEHPATFISTPSGASTPAGATLHKQAYHSIARCVAALLVVRSTRHGCDAVVEVVDGFLTAVGTPGVTRSAQLLAILGLGEIGRCLDLGSRVSRLQTVLLECFSSSCDDVKQAAAVAIGAVAVGNLDAMLKFILAEIRSQPTKRQYLLLHSLKEVISSQQQQQQLSLQQQKVSAAVYGDQQHSLAPFVKQIWDLLMKNCECQEEGTRNVVAECLGRLALLNAQELIPQLRACLALPSPHARGTAIAAVKFVVSDQPQPYDGLLKQSIGDFLGALKDPDAGVRRVALVTFNSVAHNKPSLMRDLLHDVLPHLYSETKIRNELIREVEMGPFKHTVDDGLDIRKAAFECMYTLLDSCLDRIDIFEFLTHVEDGLADHYDIKMLTYLMLIRLSHLCPGAILQRLDHIVEALKATCMSKVRATSVKQEFEKQDELKRSAMRAVAAILLIPDADKNPLLSDFLSQIRQNQELSAILDSVKETSTTSSAVTGTLGSVDPCLMDMS